MAKRGPQQTEEEKKANPLPELLPTDVPETHETIDVDSHIAVVPSDFKDREIKTDTQAHEHERRAHEEKIRAQREKEVKAEAERIKRVAKEKTQKAQSALLSIARDVRTWNLVDAMVLIALGVLGYRRFKEGGMDWKVAGAGVAALGLFATAQSYVRQFFNRGAR